MPYEPPEIPEDEDEATARILDNLAEKLPGWEPVDGAVDVALAEEIGRESVLVRGTAVEAVATAVAGIGETVFGVPVVQAAPARLDVNITVTAAGDVVPAGFTALGVNAAGVEVSFQTLESITTTAAVQAATMWAVDPGALGNGVPAGPLTVTTATATVVAVAATSASADGVDDEPLDTYLGRLVDYVATLRPGGVRADDLASLARSVPGVHRALGVDLYDPANPYTDSERTATVFPIDQAGAPVPPAVAAEVAALLEASREVNFVIHVAQPTYTAVNVVYEAVAEAGADPAAVAAAVDAAVLGWLAAWGTTPDDDTAWVPSGTVRYLELARVAGSADGVAFISSLTINGAAADLALPGVAALPAPPTDPVAPSTVAGTVT